MQKALSPLIATILLIGLSIVLAVSIFGFAQGWFSGLMGGTEEKSSSEIYALQNARVDINHVKLTKDGISVSVINTGNSDVKAKLNFIEGEEIITKDISINKGEVFSNTYGDVSNVDKVIVSLVEVDGKAIGSNIWFEKEVSLGNSVLYLPFDNDVKDYSGNGNDGILDESGELIANGGAETGDKTNFPSFDGVTNIDSHSGTYSFYEEGPGSFGSTEYIEIGLDKTYTIEGWFKSYGSGGNSRLYYGFTPYDEDKVRIANEHINVVLNTKTTLFEDIESSDKIVKIVDGTNWYVLYHARMAFNIDDSGNYMDLPNRDISNQNIMRVENMGSYWEIEFNTNVGKTYPVGTKVRMHTSGGTYMYSAASGALVPPSWTRYSRDVQGESLYDPTTNKWWRGTKYVRLLFLNNYAQDNTYKIRGDDFSLTSNPETYTGPEFVDGKIGKALSFDGVDDWVDFTDSNSLDITGTEITVEFWMYPYADASHSDTGLVIKGSMVYGCTYHTNDVWCYLNGGGNSVHVYNLDPNTWHHIVQTYDGVNIKTYKDGVFEEERNLTGNIQNGGALQIGKFNNVFNGIIDGVRIYDYALTEKQIKDLYGNG